jgi:hypothetical protein
MRPAASPSAAGPRAGGLTSLSDIPSDPNWRFPSLAFDSAGSVLPPDWISDLLTDEQKKIPGAIVDAYRTNPGEIAEPWNTFVLDDWNAGDDEIVKQIYQQNDIATLMTLIRGH